MRGSSAELGLGPKPREIAELRFDLHKSAPSAQLFAVSTSGTHDRPPVGRFELRPISAPVGRNGAPSPLSPRRSAMRGIDSQLTRMTSAQLVSSVVRSAELASARRAVLETRERSRQQPPAASPAPASDLLLGFGAQLPRAKPTARRLLIGGANGRGATKAVRSTSKARNSLSAALFNSAEDENAARERQAAIAEHSGRSRAAQEALALAISCTAAGSSSKLRVEVSDNPLLVDARAPEHQHFLAQMAALRQTTDGGGGGSRDDGSDAELDTDDDEHARDEHAHDEHEDDEQQQSDSHADGHADDHADDHGSHSEGDEAAASIASDAADAADAAAAVAPRARPPARDSAFGRVARSAKMAARAARQPPPAARGDPATRERWMGAAKKVMADTPGAIAAREAAECAAVKRRWEARHASSLSSAVQAEEAEAAAAEGARRLSVRAGAAAVQPTQASAGDLQQLDLSQIVHLRHLFDKADVDGSTSLTRDEFVSVFRELWASFPAASAKAAAQQQEAPPPLLQYEFTPQPASDDDAAPGAKAGVHKWRAVVGAGAGPAAGPAGAAAPPVEPPPRPAAAAAAAASPAAGGPSPELSAELESALVDIFLKIDSHSDGVVTWAEFLSFTILHSQLIANAREHISVLIPSTFLPPQLAFGGVSASVHPTPVTHIVPLPDAHKILTCSRDGVCALWSAGEMRLERSFLNAAYLPRRSAASKATFAAGTNDPWIQAVCYLPERSCVLIGSADRHVLFYDAASWDARRFVPWGRIQLANEPTTLVYAKAALRLALPSPPPASLLGLRAAAESVRSQSWASALVVGDARGDVLVFELGALCAFARALQAKLGGGELMLTAKSYPTPTLRLAAVHSDWITAAEWIPDPYGLAGGGGGTLATGSLDRTIALSDLVHARVKGRLLGHRKQISSLAYLSVLDALASCGLDSDIYIWPTTLESSRPLAVLHGHCSPVARVMAVEGESQLISVGSDGSIRLWDTSMNRCLQLLNEPTRTRTTESSGAVELPALDVSAAALDPQSGGLLTAHSTPAFWPARKASRTDQKTHDHTPSLVVYNPSFQIVVSADESSTLAVWKVETGQCLGQFDRAHGVSKITSLAFDASGRRLISGAHDGSVRVWNFSSGECLKACVCAATDAVEVTGVSHLAATKLRPAVIITVGWSKALSCFADVPPVSKSANLFPDSREPVETVGAQVRAQLHQGDIACIATLPLAGSAQQTLVVTAGYDGELVVWELDAFADSDGRISLKAVRAIRPHLPPKAQAAQAGMGAQAENKLVLAARMLANLTNASAKWRSRTASFSQAPLGADSLQPPGSQPPSRRVSSASRLAMQPSGSPSGSPSAPNSCAASRRDSCAGLSAPASPESARRHSGAGAAPLSGGAPTPHLPSRRASVRASMSAAAGPRAPPASSLDEVDEHETVSVERMVFLAGRPRQPLLSIGSDACISAWNVFTGTCTHRFAAAHHANEPLVGLTTDGETSSMVVTADAAGWVKIWRIKRNAWSRKFELTDELPAPRAAGAPRCHSGNGGGQGGGGGHGGVGGAKPTGAQVAPPGEVRVGMLPAVSTDTERDEFLVVEHWWRVHQGGLVSIELVAQSEKVLSATTDGNVSVWSLQGELIGTFGQSGRWDAHDKVTWRSLRPISINASMWEHSHANRALTAMRAIHAIADLTAEGKAQRHAPTTEGTRLAVRDALADATDAVQRFIGLVLPPAADQRALRGLRLDGASLDSRPQATSAALRKTAWPVRHLLPEKQRRERRLEELWPTRPSTASRAPAPTEPSGAKPATGEPAPLALRPASAAAAPHRAGHARGARAASAHPSVHPFTHHMPMFEMKQINDPKLARRQRRQQLDAEAAALAATPSRHAWQQSSHTQPTTPAAGSRPQAKGVARIGFTFGGQHALL